MRKRVLPSTQDTPAPTDDWLDLEPLAEVEITSEDPGHPIESALADANEGWRAAGPGVQVIRLVFDSPQPLRRIRLEFREATTQRTQEYVLRWTDQAGEVREIVRQQWNFNPGDAAEQTEDYTVELPAVAALELEITPDISGGSAVASLEKLRLA